MKHFKGRQLPESGEPVGYAALVDRYDLQVPLPSRLTAIARRHHPESTREWQMLTPTHAPDESLQGQLEFAVKWEGVSLGVLLALFRRLDPHEIVRIIHDKPTGAYARRIWFLYEWLTDVRLEVPDAGKVRAVPVLDPAQQFASEEGPLSRRHRVRNNLPGTNQFCPLVRRTPELDRYVGMGLNTKALEVIGRTHPDVVRRAAAFLLLEDSKASFEIEGERLSQDRALRWGQAIRDAGQRDLTVEELERLQEMVIGDARFVPLGLRTEGGWLGDRDRRTGEPIPTHISAHHKDLPDLMQGVVEYERRTEGSSVDPVVVAAALSFGFVYIHPFEDGNGRIHRWLVHHVLARAGYNPPGLVFPVSAPMLRRIEDYRDVLESYSVQVLPLVEWRPTEHDNVEVLNETGDYYRFFDATWHAEFLYRCVEETVTQDLPREVEYLEGYDEFSKRVQDEIADMPERMINLLSRFLERNGGLLSERARTREFEQLSAEEVQHIEELYARCFPKLPPEPAGYRWTSA
jgi:hypothetical protein